MRLLVFVLMIACVLDNWSVFVFCSFTVLSSLFHVFYSLFSYVFMSRNAI